MKDTLGCVGKLLLSVCMGVSVFNIRGAVTVVEDVEAGSVNRPYISPVAGKIPIMASSLCLYGTLPTSKEIQEFRDCGFDVLIQDNSEELYDSLVAMLEGSGVRLFPSANALRGPSKEKCREFMERYKDNPVVCGWEFRDEPKFADLDMYEGIFDVMTETDPHHMIHLNVVGTMEKAFVGPETPDMSAYLDTLQAKFAPGVWSYDMYPLKILDNNGKLIVDYDIFYSDFEAFSNMARKTGRPFWAYCQGVGFRQGRICKPIPKEEYLRFEAFSALAYGAQGLIYWTYRQCRDVPSVDFEYLDGPIDINGNKTKVWYAAKKVNEEINRYSDVFLGAQLVDVVHTGKRLYSSTRRMPDSGFGPLSNFSSGDSGVLVSNLRNGRQSYYVVVSHDVAHAQNITFGLRKGTAVKSMADGKVLVGNGRTYSFTLPPGGYLILRMAN